MPLCMQAIFVTLEAIIHDSSVSNGTILCLINFEAAKQICQAIIAMLNVLRHGMQPILLHV